MNIDYATHSLPTKHGELPHEVLLSIQRVLDIQEDAAASDLEAISSSFSPVNSLNAYFPDGMLLYAGHGMYSHFLFFRGILNPVGSYTEQTNTGCTAVADRNR